MFFGFLIFESLRNLCGVDSNRLDIRASRPSSSSSAVVIFMNDRSPFESPLEPFESPKELLNGAKERLTDLESMCNAISETRDYEFITNTDPKTREKVVKLKLKQKFPPRIRSLASNIVKELRTTLDQSFCEAAVMLGRKNAKGIYFPFGRDPKNLELVVKGKCFNDVDPRLIDYCLLFKPHYGGDSDGILWSMSNLAGSTHQTIVGAGFQDTTFLRGGHCSSDRPIADYHQQMESPA